MRSQSLNQRFLNVRSRLRGRHRQHQHRRWWRGVLGGIVGLLLVAVPAVGQSPSGTGTGGESVLDRLAFPEISNFFTREMGDIATAPVRLDGYVVFEVAAPAQDSTLTARQRSREIGQRLQAIAQDRTSSIEVTSQVDELSNQPILYINGEPLMTITSLDAEVQGSRNLTFRANQIAVAIETALKRYRQERQPDHLWHQGRWAAAVFLGMVLGSFVLAYFQQTLGKSASTPKAEVEMAENRRPSASGDPAVTALRQTLLARQQVQMLKVQRHCLQLGQLGVWSGGGFIILGLFPYSRWLQPWLVSALQLPLRILVIFFVTYGLIRLSAVGIDRLFLTMQDQAGLTLERSQRLALRLSTFSQVINSITAVAIATIAVFIVLSQLGLQIAPLLAGAGIVGIAISLASQSLVKDIINGFLILLEDQYGVGDVILVKEVSGFVETMNLRITQIRNEEGRLITIPNGQIDIVQNLSKEWARVDFMIPVGLTADLDQALALVETTAHDLSRDGIWGSLILEPPLLLGIEKLDSLGATIRIWIKTQPLKQWDVAREYRRRLKFAFEEAGVPIGMPQQQIYVASTRGRGDAGTHGVGSDRWGKGGDARTWGDRGGGEDGGERG